MEYFQFWWSKKRRKELDSSLTARDARAPGQFRGGDSKMFFLEVCFVFTFISALEVASLLSLPPLLLYS
jgi:hypothetical protein